MGAAAFDICKSADGISTGIAVSSGKFHEANPLLKGLVGPGWHHLLPFGIGVTALIVVYNWADNAGYVSGMAATGVNTVTCGVAARNVLLMVK